MGERDINQQQLPVTHEHVGGLDVAVGEPGIPQTPDHRHALVDDVVVDLGLGDLSRPLEELGDDEVLALGRQLDDADRRRRRDTGIADDAQRVVLLLRQPTHRLERGLVLESPIEDRSERLVPAVGAHVRFA